MQALFWTLGGFAAWALLATGIALVLGRVMRSRDERCGPCDVDAYEPVDVLL